LVPRHLEAIGREERGLHSNDDISIMWKTQVSESQVNIPEPCLQNADMLTSAGSAGPSGEIMPSYTQAEGSLSFGLFWTDSPLCLWPGSLAASPSVLKDFEDECHP
jgi:hypothetical protein